MASRIFVKPVAVHARFNLIAQQFANEERVAAAEIEDAPPLNIWVARSEESSRRVRSRALPLVAKRHRCSSSSAASGGVKPRVRRAIQAFGAVGSNHDSAWRPARRATLSIAASVERPANADLHDEQCRTHLRERAERSQERLEKTVARAPRECGQRIDVRAPASISGKIAPSRAARRPNIERCQHRRSAANAEAIAWNGRCSGEAWRRADTSPDGRDERKLRGDPAFARSRFSADEHKRSATARRASHAFVSCASWRRDRRREGRSARIRSAVIVAKGGALATRHRAARRSEARWFPASARSAVVE